MGALSEGMREEFQIDSEAEMIEAGHHLARRLRAGDFVSLCGDLGAGKTHFCKGLVAGLGCEEDVASPTFSLVREYRSRAIPVFHFDWYRIESAAEVLALGWDDYLDEGGITLVEWADLFTELLPKDEYRIDITILSENRRRITISHS